MSSKSNKAVNTSDRSRFSENGIKLINELRLKIQHAYAKNESNKEINDELKVLNDCYLYRFLRSNNWNVYKALDAIHAFIRWRVCIALGQLEDHSFPAEFYRIGGLFIYPPTRDGKPLLYMRVKMVLKLPELDAILKIFVAYLVDKIDRIAARSMQSWSIVFDCSEIGYANVHLSLLRYLIKLLCEYFPFGISQIIVYEVPWLLSAFQRVVFAMLPEEGKKIVTFRTRANIGEVIERENLPDYMGGQCEIDYRSAPVGCCDVEQMAFQSYGFDIDQIRKLKKHFRQYLTESART